MNLQPCIHPSVLNVLNSLISSTDIPVEGNITYGDDREHIMDIYPPIVRNETMPTKFIVLVHDGGWTNGSKENLNGAIPTFRFIFPQHVLAAINYRLGTVESPGFPKQVDDIGIAIKYLKGKAAEYKVDDPKFGLIGWSAGGTLALLFAYGFDTGNDVKVVSNIVGPVALQENVYTNNPAHKQLFSGLVGNFSFAENPEIYAKASPVSYIKKNSPKTIAFFGSKDPIVPFSQGMILEDMLDELGVYNKRFIYDAGHGNFISVQSAHIVRKLQQFLIIFKEFLKLECVCSVCCPTSHI